jgi:hypothetical protein
VTRPGRFWPPIRAAGSVRQDPALTGESIETTRFPCCFGASFATGPFVGVAANKKKTATKATAKPAAKKSSRPKPAGKSAKPTRTDGKAELPAAQLPTAAARQPRRSCQPATGRRRTNAISLPDEPQPLANLRHHFDHRAQPGQRQAATMAAAGAVQGHFLAALAGPSAGKAISTAPASTVTRWPKWRCSTPTGKRAVATPQLQLVSQVAKQDRHFDITRRGSRCRTQRSASPLPAIEQSGPDRWTRAPHRRTRRWSHQGSGRPGQGDLRLGGGKHDSYDPSLSGIGRGDVEAMLDSGQLSGKSADIALLFVGLCRSIGIPARPVFGLRIDSSRLVCGSRRDRQPAHRAAVPRRILYAGLWLDSGRSRPMCARPSTTNA